MYMYIDYTFRANIQSIKNDDINIKIQNYNESNGDKIPTNIMVLKICDNNNITINNLSNSLTQLDLESSVFNNTLNNLPILDKLTTNVNSFNNTINNLSTLKKLFFRSVNFNKKINNLPTSLINLGLYIYNFNKKIYKLPYNLETASLNFKSYKSINSFPCNIKIISFTDLNKEINNLPHLTNDIYFQYKFKNKINNLSKSLNKLNINSFHFNKKINNLPHNLSYLNLYCDNLNHSLNKLPALDIFSLYCKTKLNQINGNFKHFRYCNNELINYLPNIETLELGSYYKSLDNLPYGVKILHLPHYENKITKLPNSIEEIYFGNYNHVLDFLPNSIKKIELNEYNLTLDFLPEGLEVLKIIFFKDKINDLPSSIKEIRIKEKSSHLVNKIYQNKVIIV